METSTKPHKKISHEMRSIMTQKDWSETPLGPRREWPQTLKTAVNIVLDCTFPKIVLWGDDLIQIYNDDYRRIMGEKHPAGLGQPTKECWPEIWEFNRPIYKRIFDGEIIEIENQFFQINRYGRKEDVWFTLSYSPIRDEDDGVGSYSPIRDEDDGVGGVLVTVFETTEKLRAEASLKESEKKFRQLAENIDSIFWIYSWPERKPLYVSPAVEKILGINPKKILEGGIEAWIQMIHPEDQHRISKAHKNQINNGAFAEEYRIITRDSNMHWLYGRSFPIYNENGEAYRIVGIVEDITEQKHQQEKLKHMNETLEQRVEERTEALKDYQDKLRSLVGKLSNAEENERRRLAGELHDNLGQMLAICKMDLNTLYEDGRDSIPDEVAQIKEMIDNAITYTRRLVSDLEPPPSSDNMDLHATLEWVARKMKKYHLEVTIEDDDQPISLDTKNRSTLLQIVRELLFNVVKHAGVKQASIVVCQRGQQVKVSVEDKGEGFDVEKAQESFMNESVFGLFNIRERVDLMGGTFHIESERGKGTRAVVNLPLRNKENQKEDVAQRKKEVSESSNALKLRRIKVIIVDDHQMIRKAITKILNREKDICVTNDAGSGEEAFEAVSKAPPDVIIMDINLPGINGIEATKKIKEAYPQIAIIGLSFHNDKDMINEMYRAGASGFISKGEALDVICKKIREVGR